MARPGIFSAQSGCSLYRSLSSEIISGSTHRPNFSPSPWIFSASAGSPPLIFSSFTSQSPSAHPEKDAIAHMVGIGRDTLENHLHCLSVLRNKCAHAARMYNTDFNPPAKFTTSFLRKHPEIKNNSLFAYTLVLLKRLPDESSKKSLIQNVENVISEYSDDIDLNLIGFPENYMEIMKNSL